MFKKAASQAAHHRHDGRLIVLTMRGQREYLASDIGDGLFLAAENLRTAARLRLST